MKVSKTVYRRTNAKLALSAMMLKGNVISEKDAGTLRITKANRYVLFEEMYRKLNLESVGSEEAKARLVKCYIKAFGPVTEEDIAWWTGFSKTDIKKAMATAEKELLPVKINGLKEDYLMLKTDYEQFVKFKPLKTRSLQLLPYEDPFTKGYKTRDRLIDREQEKKAYVGGGVQPSILLNGKIIGTWSRNIEQGKGPIKLEFFMRPERDVEKEVVQTAKAIAGLMGSRETKIEVRIQSEQGHRA